MRATTATAHHPPLLPSRHRQLSILHHPDSVVKPTLPIVAILGDAEWCRVMLEGGADVESVDIYGYRAIHNAAEFGHNDTAAVLLEHGAADVNAVSSCGWTALLLATSHGHADTAALLREHGGVEFTV